MATSGLLLAANNEPFRRQIRSAVPNGQLALDAWDHGRKQTMVHINTMSQELHQYVNQITHALRSIGLLSAVSPPPKLLADTTYSPKPKASTTNNVAATSADAHVAAVASLFPGHL